MNRLSNTSAFSPGDRVIYRDGSCYNVARVDLVRDRHLTSFPFDRARGAYHKGRKRIAVDTVVARLGHKAQPKQVAAILNGLMNRRDSMRRSADQWLREQVAQLAEGQAGSSATGLDEGQMIELDELGYSPARIAREQDCSVEAVRCALTKAGNGACHG